MRPLYNARLSDLGPGDLVQIECVCGHEELMTAAMIRQAGPPEFGFVLDLQRRLRCRVMLCGNRKEPPGSGGSLAHFRMRMCGLRFHGRLHRASCRRFDRMTGMVKTLELAISKAAELPEAAQEQLGREILERLDALAELRAELSIGIRELDAGLGEPLDIEDVIAEARREHAGK
jgi:hypothetical protein